MASVVGKKSHFFLFTYTVPYNCTIPPLGLCSIKRTFFLSNWSLFTCKHPPLFHNGGLFRGISTVEGREGRVLIKAPLLAHCAVLPHWVRHPPLRTQFQPKNGRKKGVDLASSIGRRRRKVRLQSHLSLLFTPPPPPPLVVVP